jgi:hypothetical protein
VRHNVLGHQAAGRRPPGPTGESSYRFGCVRYDVPETCFGNIRLLVRHDLARSHQEWHGAVSRRMSHWLSAGHRPQGPRMPSEGPRRLTRQITRPRCSNAAYGHTRPTVAIPGDCVWVHWGHDARAPRRCPTRCPGRRPPGAGHRSPAAKHQAPSVPPRPRATQGSKREAPSSALFKRREGSKRKRKRKAKRRQAPPSALAFVVSLDDLLTDMRGHTTGSNTKE